MSERELTPDERMKIEQVADKLGGQHREWLEEFAQEHELGYNELMDGAADWIAIGEYTCIGVDIDYDAMGNEFWTHYEAVIGGVVEPDKRTNFFSCAC
jgi:hypothetical protein